MLFPDPQFGLMLKAVILLSIIITNICIAQPHGHKFHHDRRLAVRDDGAGQTTAITPVTEILPITLTASATPCSSTNCVTAAVPMSTLGPDCSAMTDISFNDLKRDTSTFDLICNIDFPGQNIYPFILAGSFLDCYNQCYDFNQNKTGPRCAGFVFAPDPIDDDNDCYLKSSLNEPSPATVPLIGATVVESNGHSTIDLPASTATAVGKAEATPTPKFHTPSISDRKLLGSSNNNPTKQYVKHAPVLPQKLAETILVPGINVDLINNYGLASDTGVWTTNDLQGSEQLEDLTVTPRLSRDGGKGGTIDGTHLFVFCDTASYSPSGQMVEFVSSSVAVDQDMNGLDGKALSLVDMVGGWQDDVARLRGLSPMTTGEESFNKALSGQGYRYAVWPESSLIPLNKTHSLLYASLVYDEVDMSTQDANFTTLGNTLLMVSVDSKYGPFAQRMVKQLFKQDEVTWGSLGGLRAWPEAGSGGHGGKIYLFGQVDGGVLVARTTPNGITDRSSYTYWDGSDWSSEMLPRSSTAYFLDRPVMDLDVTYSPYHNTFIMVYLTPNADNTFYYRYLKSDIGILPPYEQGGSEDYVENILKKEWSDEQVLYEADAPTMGYIYAGGMHAGYFGDEDITNGGGKMLLSWTEHTGKPAESDESGYAHKTVVITLD